MLSYGLPRRTGVAWSPNTARWGGGVFVSASGVPSGFFDAHPSSRRFWRIGVVVVAGWHFAGRRPPAGDPCCSVASGFARSGSTPRAHSSTRQPGPVQGSGPESIGGSSRDSGRPDNRKGLDTSRWSRRRRAGYSHRHDRETPRFASAGTAVGASRAVGAGSTTALRASRTGTAVGAGSTTALRASRTGTAVGSSGAAGAGSPSRVPYRASRRTTGSSPGRSWADQNEHRIHPYRGGLHAARRGRDNGCVSGPGRAAA